MIKRYCDNPKCGKEILGNTPLIIPPGELLEHHALRVELRYSASNLPVTNNPGDFCRQCVIGAIRGLGE